MKKKITAKADMIRHTGWPIQLHEWHRGQAYTAEWIGGSIILDSEQGPVEFSGCRRDDVYEGFIWEEDLVDRAV